MVPAVTTVIDKIGINVYTNNIMKCLTALLARKKLISNILKFGILLGIILNASVANATVYNALNDGGFELASYDDNGVNAWKWMGGAVILGDAANQGFYPRSGSNLAAITTGELFQKVSYDYSSFGYVKMYAKWQTVDTLWSSYAYIAIKVRAILSNGNTVDYVKYFVIYSSNTNWKAFYFSNTDLSSSTSLVTAISIMGFGSAGSGYLIFADDVSVYVPSSSGGGSGGGSGPGCKTGCAQ